MNKEQCLAIIEKAKQPDPFPFADEIMEAFERLEELGEPEFAMLKAEYVKGRLEFPLKAIFEDYLLFNEEKRAEIESLAKMSHIAEKYADEVFASIDSGDTIVVATRPKLDIKTLSELLRGFVFDIPIVKRPARPYAFAKKKNKSLQSIFIDHELSESEQIVILTCLDFVFDHLNKINEPISFKELKELVVKIVKEQGFDSDLEKSVSSILIEIAEQGNET